MLHCNFTPSNVSLVGTCAHVVPVPHLGPGWRRRRYDGHVEVKLQKETQLEQRFFSLCKVAKFNEVVHMTGRASNSSKETQSAHSIFRLGYIQVWDPFFPPLLSLSSPNGILLEKGLSGFEIHDVSPRISFPNIIRLCTSPRASLTLDQEDSLRISPRGKSGTTYKIADNFDMQMLNLFQGKLLQLLYSFSYKSSSFDLFNTHRLMSAYQSNKPMDSEIQAFRAAT